MRVTRQDNLFTILINLQKVEAAALSLFRPEDSYGTLEEVTSKSSVVVPELLHYDADSNVLVMSDLGPHPSMTELFAELGGSNIYASHDSAPAEKVSSQNRGMGAGFFAEIGVRYGSFFALLHSPNSLKIVRRRFGSETVCSGEPSTREAIFQQGVKPTVHRLALFPQQLSATGESADQIFERIEADFRRANVDEELAFTLGDPWPNALLVEIPKEQCSPRKLAVIDWEFASIGRGINVDFAAMLAHFALFEITAEHAAASASALLDNCLVEKVRVFRHGMVTQYRCVSQREDAPWSWAKHDHVLPRPSDVQVLILRSSMISHAVEMIRCVTRRNWNCGHNECVAFDHELDQRKGDCTLLKRMMTHALWYLQHARSDAVEFCQPSNWDIVKAGRYHGFWLLDLFFDTGAS